MATHLLFLSHAGIDSDAATALADRLEASPEGVAYGLQVWIDRRHLGAGERWKRALEDALARSTAFAVYVGGRGLINWVQDEVDVALDKVKIDRTYPIVSVLAEGTDVGSLPSFLSQYQGVQNVERDGDAFNRLLRAVLRLEPQMRVEAEAEPFVGLRAYDSRKAHLFFGRAPEIGSLLELLRTEHLVMVTGNSGSGKSSLVKAGLLPAFRGGRLDRRQEDGRPPETIWYTVETRPGSDPFARLADDLREAGERGGATPAVASEIADLVRTKRADKVRDAVLSSAPRAVPHACQILIIVDQFEEFRNSPDAKAYADTIVKLADSGDDRIRVVLTMRRDYYFACSLFPALYSRLEAHDRRARLLLTRMPKESMTAAVIEPLRLAGVDPKEAEALASAVLKDAGDEPGELALLQMALWHTWRLHRDSRIPLLQAYGDIGRVEGALAKAADSVFEKLPTEERERAETLFVRLVRPGETGGVTRRIAPLDEFDERTQELARRLATQEHGRLITLGEGTVEIAHEQLATQWPRYQSWISNIANDKRGNDLRTLHSLIVDASGWEAELRGQKRGRLARDHQLDLFESISECRPSWINMSERLYVKSSKDAAWWSSASRRSALALLMLLTCIAGLFWWQSSQRAEELETATARAEDRALAARVQLLASQARRLDAQATTLDEIELSGALALESIALAQRNNRPMEPDAFEAAVSIYRRLPAKVLRQDEPETSFDSSPTPHSLAAIGGGRLASAGSNGTIKIWPADAEKETMIVHHLVDESFTFGQDNHEVKLAVLRDGRVASSGDDGKIKIWSTDFSDDPRELDHGSGIISLLALRDGRLASGGRDGEVKIWPVESQEEPIVLNIGVPVTSLAELSGERLAVGGVDDSIVLLSLTGSNEREVLREPTGVQFDEVLAMVVLEDGRLASAGDRNGTIQIWSNTATEKPFVMHTSTWVRSLVLLKSGYFASGGYDGTIRLWPRDGIGEPIILHHASSDKSPVISLAVLENGTLVSGGVDGTLKYWPQDDWNEPETLRHGAPVTSLAELSDGRLVSGADDGTLQIWPMDRQGEPETLDQTVEVTALAALDDGAFVSASPFAIVVFWGLSGETGPAVLNLKQHGYVLGDNIPAIAKLGDGRLAIGRSDGTITLWPKEGKGEPVNLEIVGRVNALVVTRDGRLVSGDWVGNLAIWPAEGQDRPKEVKSGSLVQSLAAFNDGRIASGSQDGQIFIWPSDFEGGPKIHEHGSTVNSLAVLHDGQLVSAGQDGKIKLWPTDRGSEPVVLRHGASVSSLVVLHNGLLAAGGSDGTVKLWLVEREKLIAGLCARAGRNLSEQEWSRYVGPEEPWRETCPAWRTPPEESRLKRLLISN